MKLFGRKIEKDPLYIDISYLRNPVDPPIGPLVRNLARVRTFRTMLRRIIAASDMLCAYNAILGFNLDPVRSQSLD
jgi:hypothetical protein